MNTQQKIIKLIKMSAFHSMFVAQCISDKSKEILSNKEAVLESNKGSLINPETWIQCSEDAQNILS